jgi:hypothetical protein
MDQARQMTVSFHPLIPINVHLNTLRYPRRPPPPTPHRRLFRQAIEAKNDNPTRRALKMTATPPEKLLLAHQKSPEMTTRKATLLIKLLTRAEMTTKY